MPWTFTNEAGTELNLDDGSDYEVVRWSESGTPNLALGSTVRQSRPGAVIRRASLPMRRITLLMWVKGTSESDHDQNFDAFQAHIAGSYGRDEPRFGVLKYTRSDSSVRSLRCVATGGLSRPHDMRLSPTLSRVMLTFTGDHPNWYDPTEQSTTITIGDGAQVTWPVTWPVTWGLDGFAGAATINNTGSAETRSLTWEVEGPVTAPALFNATTAEQIRLPNLVVPSGLKLRVRSGWGPDGKRDAFAVLVSTGGSETSVIGEIDSGSRFPRMDPGNNRLEVSQSNDASTGHTIKHTREYLAA